MSVKIKIPAPLRKLTGGSGEVSASASTLGGLIGSLESDYPGIQEKICDEAGKLRPFINLYINNRDARYLGELDAPVKDGDKVSIVPAIAGG